MKATFRWLLPALFIVCLLMYYLFDTLRVSNKKLVIHKVFENANTSFRKTESAMLRGSVTNITIEVPAIKTIENYDNSFQLYENILGIDPRRLTKTRTQKQDLFQTKNTGSSTAKGNIQRITPPPTRRTTYHASYGTPPPHNSLINPVPNVRVDNIDCDKLFDNDRDEMEKALNEQSNKPYTVKMDNTFIDLASDCTTYRSRYITRTLSQEEKDFPIAFSLLMYKQVEQVEKLLRAIYAPQNYYCIHVDKKAAVDTRNAMQSIAACFDNVFLSSESFDVKWGEFSVLEPELQCMQDLWKYKKWKYFINLTGQEFPLKTNLHLVKILKSYKGANNMEGTIKRRNFERTQFIHKNGVALEIEKKPPPRGIVITKGSVHITACRGFVDYILHNRTGQIFLRWVQDTGIPDETFFSSLNHSPDLNIPGAYKGIPESNKNSYLFLTRFKNWFSWPFSYPCKGKNVRSICIFGVGDLPLIASRPELFANKFYLDYQPLTYQCLEERHYKLIKQDILGERIIDTSFYEQQDFVQNHVNS